jgi:DNA-binding Lrp family transcriptional regulator
MTEKTIRGMDGFDPMAMCQAMMTSVSTSAEMAAYATPEVRALFEEWARSVEDEIAAALADAGELDLEALAARVKISPASVMYFLARLVKAGKVSVSGVKLGPGARTR